MTEQKDYWNQLSAHPLDASVIDPNDHAGHKNRYLAGIRNREILAALAQVDPARVVLDLGCGTGSLTAALVAVQRDVIGLDISSGLLQRTGERKLGDAALFARYDGARFPLRDNCVGAITTYVVLNHLLDTSDLTTVLSECHRVLVPGGLMICIEQIRQRTRVNYQEWKRQYSLDELCAALSAAGLRSVLRKIVRYGHFPTTPLIRFGLVPARAFDSLAGAEQAWGRYRGIPARDYCDMLFVLQKPGGPG